MFQPPENTNGNWTINIDPFPELVLNYKGGNLIWAGGISSQNDLPWLIVFYIPDFHSSSNAGVFQLESSDMGGNLAGGWVNSLVSGWLEPLLGGKETEK